MIGSPIQALSQSSNDRNIGVGEELAPLGTASRSAVALASVERAVAAHESWFGRERLLRLVADIPQDHIVDHVAFYREIVRNGSWPNESAPSALPAFIDDFERAAALYVATAFRALAFVESGKPHELPELAHLVTASEALRGQFGKRSPTGLDARLEEYERELEGLLASIPDASASLNLLCTPAEPHLAAESMLLEDLALLQDAFPTAPTQQELLRETSERTEIAWVFLRRHARWSLTQMRTWYRELSGDPLLGLLRNAREQRRRMAEARCEALDRLSSVVGKTAIGRIRDAATASTLLNNLNLALEPCFSFKGGVGLAHALIFRMMKSVLMPPLLEEEIRLRKWHLFNPSEKIGNLGGIL